MERKPLGLIQGMKDFLMGIERDVESSGDSPEEAARRAQELAGNRTASSERTRYSEDN